MTWKWHLAPLLACEKLRWGSSGFAETFNSVIFDFFAELTQFITAYCSRCVQLAQALEQFVKVEGMLQQAPLNTDSGELGSEFFPQRSAMPGGKLAPLILGCSGQGCEEGSSVHWQNTF